MRLYQVLALLCLDFTGPSGMPKQLNSASSPLSLRLTRGLRYRSSLRKPCPGRSTGTECSRSDLAGQVKSNCIRRCTGRSTNGRSSAFGALCLGSNPSRPTNKSTPDATRRIRDLRRQQQLAAAVRRFWTSRKTARRKMYEEKSRSLLVFLSSPQQGFQKK